MYRLTALALELGRPEFQQEIQNILVWSWANYSIYLSFNFFTCKNGNNIYLTVEWCYENEIKKPVKCSVAHIKNSINSEPLFLKWNLRKIWKVPSFITKTFINDHKMPQQLSNLTYYKTDMIKKEHTDCINSVEILSVEFRNSLLQCRYCIPTQIPYLTEWRAQISHWTNFIELNNVSSGLSPNF